MSDIVNIQITPVKEIIVLPVRENFVSYPSKSSRSSKSSKKKSSSQNRNDDTVWNAQYALNKKKAKAKVRAEMFNPNVLTPYQIKS